MTTPPVAHQLMQPNYSKFLGNIPCSSSAAASCVSSAGTSSSSSNRSSSRSSSHHSSNAVAAAAAAAVAARSGRSPNVTINPNLMPYGSSPYGYQMASQSTASAQALGYINGSPAFINQTQLPVRMGVMNVSQNQYAQDPTQNSMYSAYYGAPFMRNV